MLTDIIARYTSSFIVIILLLWCACFLWNGLGRGAFLFFLWLSSSLGWCHSCHCFLRLWYACASLSFPCGNGFYFVGSIDCCSNGLLLFLLFSYSTHGTFTDMSSQTWYSSPTTEYIRRSARCATCSFLLTVLSHSCDSLFHCCWVTRPSDFHSEMKGPMATRTTVRSYPRRRWRICQRQSELEGTGEERERERESTTSRLVIIRQGWLFFWPTRTVTALITPRILSFLYISPTLNLVCVFVVMSSMCSCVWMAMDEWVAEKRDTDGDGRSINKCWCLRKRLNHTKYNTIFICGYDMITFFCKFFHDSIVITIIICVISWDIATSTVDTATTARDGVGDGNHFHLPIDNSITVKWFGYIHPSIDWTKTNMTHLHSCNTQT